jgi:iron complex outermembrane receptor protein
VAIFLTTGKGFYEQYKVDRARSSVGLPDYFDGTTTIKKTDIILKSFRKLAYFSQMRII